MGSVFDPFGFVAPFVLTGKKILQDLCRLKLGWDDEVPAEHGLRWQRWLMDIPKLSQFTIERCLKPVDFKSTVSSQLHRLVSDRSRTYDWKMTVAEFTVLSCKESRASYL